MKMLFLRCAILAALAGGIAAQASAGELKLTMVDGRVTLIADNVPLRQILQEWARVGQTTIVNADKLSGPALTLQLVDTPEREALDILLRSAAGYIAAPRAVMVANAATYDRITILATSHAPAPGAQAAAAPPPTFQRPPLAIDNDDEPINVAMPPMAPPMQANPNPMPFNPNGNNNNQVVLNPANMVPPGGFQTAQPGQQQAPITSPRPGMMMPPQNGAPNPYQPPIVRPPGGGGPGGDEL
jgi:hypothetical protein